jgi:hypothetical protein
MQLYQSRLEQQLQALRSDKQRMMLLNQELKNRWRVRAAR